MAADEKTADRGTIATIVATAAVTLAIGVTAAALGGYLAPARDRDKATAAQQSEAMVVETPPAPQTGAPNVVLVPVEPDARRDPSTTIPAAQPEMLLAAYETNEHHDDDDHHRSPKHHEREHEHDHDDD